MKTYFRPLNEEDDSRDFTDRDFLNNDPQLIDCIGARGTNRAEK